MRHYVASVSQKMGANYTTSTIANSASVARVATLVTQHVCLMLKDNHQLRRSNFIAVTESIIRDLASDLQTCDECIDVAPYIAFFEAGVSIWICAKHV